jgi:hypothetical protein
VPTCADLRKRRARSLAPVIARLCTFGERRHVGNSRRDEARPAGRPKAKDGDSPTKRYGEGGNGTSHNWPRRIGLFSRFVGSCSRFSRGCRGSSQRRRSWRRDRRDRAKDGSRFSDDPIERLEIGVRAGLAGSSRSASVIASTSNARCSSSLRVSTTSVLPPAVCAPPLRARLRGARVRVQCAGG